MTTPPSLALLCAPVLSASVPRGGWEGGAGDAADSMPAPPDAPPPLPEEVGAVPAEEGELAAWEEEQEAWLRAYEPSAACCELALPPWIPRQLRKRLHEVATRAGVRSESVGHGGARRLTFFWPEALGERTERFVDRGGYLSFEGPVVERAAAREHAEVTDGRRRRREARDGSRHHITVVNRAELRAVVEGKPRDEAVRELLLRAAREVPDDWEDQGLGRVENEAGQVAVFRVVRWPAANAFRSTLGLAPSTFHITLGFSHHDIHDVDKGPASLVPSPKEEDEEEEEKE